MRDQVVADAGTQSTVAAFKAFYATLSAQGEAIKTLERSRDELALSLRNDINAALQKKANVADTSARIAEVEVQMKGKADTSDMERRALKTDTDASLKMQMAEVLALMTSKANEAEVRALKTSHEQSMAALQSEVARLATGLEEAKAALSSKAGAGDTAVALAAKADLSLLDAQLREKVDRVTFREALAMKVDAPSLKATEDELRAVEGDLKRQLASVQASLQLKAEGAMVLEGLRRLEVRADKDSQAAAEGLSNASVAFDRALEARAEEVQTDLEELGGALRDELYGAVTDVMERQAASLERQEARLESMPDVLTVQGMIDRHASEIQGTIDKRSSEATSGLAAEIREIKMQVARMNQLLPQMELLQREVAEQGSARHALLAALEAKANVEDVNKALAEVCQQLEIRSATGGSAAALSSDGHASVPTARWLWKSCATLVGGVLPWNVQAVNTHPDVLAWSPDTSVITVHLPGLWQLSFGFFSRRRPVIQVFVNGEPVIKSQATMQSTPLKEFPDLGERRKVTMCTQHSAGNVTGLTGSEILSLPAGGTRLAVTVSGVEGPERIEGFLQLQKL